MVEKLRDDDCVLVNLLRHKVLSNCSMSSTPLASEAEECTVTGEKKEAKKEEREGAQEGMGGGRSWTCRAST